MVLSVVLLAGSVTANHDPAMAQSVRENLYVADGPVQAILTSGNTIYIGGSFLSVGPATGSAVPLDVVAGRAPLFPKVTGYVYAVAPDGSGGWYIGGDFDRVGGVARARLAHILADHSVADWDPGADGTVTALAVSGSTVYVGGAFGIIGGQARARIAALDATTGAPTSWNPGIGGPTNYAVFTLAVSDTTVYVGGQFTSIGGSSRFGLAAVSLTSGAATSWNPSPTYLGSAGIVYAMAVTGSTVYVGGFFDNVGLASRLFVAALSAATGAATPWHADANNTVLGLAATTTTVYVGGVFTSVGGSPRNNIAALDAGSGLATSWNPNALASPIWGGPQVYALAVSGSVVYAGGYFGSIGGQVRNGLAALDAVTGNATSWAPNVGGGGVRAIGIGATTVFAAGDFTTVGGQMRNRIAALDATTGMPTTWDPGANSTVYTLAAGPGVIYAGGAFTQIGGQGRNAIAALDATTGTATSWNPNANGALRGLAVESGTVYAAGTFTNIGGQPRNRIAALDASTGAATMWNPGADDTVQKVLVSGSTVYAVGAFTNVGGQARNRIAAIDAATGGVTAWNPNAGIGNSTVFAVAVDGSTLYVGGNFGSLGAQARNRAGAVDITTGVPTAWDPNVSGTVRALAVGGSSVYLGGAFNSVGGLTRNRLAEVDPTTGSPTAWDPQANATVVALATAGETVYAGGGFDRMGRVLQSFFAGISQSTTDVSPAQGDEELSKLRAIPNPARGSARIEYSVSRQTRVKVSVYDLQGREVARVVDRVMSAGHYQATWDGSRHGVVASAGIYFVCCDSGNEHRSIRLAVVR